jgi:hypothetical protein
MVSFSMYYEVTKELDGVQRDLKKAREEVWTTAVAAAPWWLLSLLLLHVPVIRRARRAALLHLS